MARSEARDEPSEQAIKLPRLSWEGRSEGDGSEGLHVHLHLPGKAARSGRPVMALVGGTVALGVAFLAGALMGGSPARSPSQAELAALQSLTGLPPMPALPQTAPGATPMLPPGGGAQGLPPHLQQQLAQPPRVQPPPGAAPAATPQPRGLAAPGAPATAPVVQGTPARNAFGLEN